MKDLKTDSEHRMLHLILRFGAIINSSLKIEDVLNYAMEWAEDFTEAEASTVYEVDEEKQDLFIRTSRGEKKESIEKIRLKLGQGIAGKVVLTGEPMVIQDVTKDPLFDPQFDLQTGFKTRSMICVPLLSRGNAIGAFQVLNKKGGKSFTSYDIELLTNMSQQIAVAMDNACLYRRLEEKFELTSKELKRAQEKLIRTERLAAVGNIVQGVAHEIRNPITTIGGFALRIKRFSSKDERLSQYVDIIIEGVERLESVVERVRQFADLLNAKPTFTNDIKALIREAVKKYHPMAEDQGVEIRVDFDDALPLVKIDYFQILTAISNILENSMESMPEGGRALIEAKSRNNRLIITVTDTGCGIAGKDLASIYDPFFTSKTVGAGLGLTMVHQVVSNHGGEIKIDSKVGKGTSVSIEIPVS